PRYRGTKNVLRGAVIIAPLELRHVKRQVFSRDVVEGAHDAAFQQGPEPVNRLCVDVAPDVFAARMVDALMRQASLGQAGVNPGLIGSDQINLLRDGLTDELGSGFLRHAGQAAGYYGALAADGADNWQLA